MTGLFIGLTTLDLIYLARHPPTPNEKLVALDYTVSAGGPATNAAIAFAHLAQSATIVSSVGCHPMTQLIHADLQQWGVTLHDLSPDKAEPPPVSSIVVTQKTGERAVISINAVKTPIPGDRLSPDVLQGVEVLLIDGHQMAVGQSLAKAAKKQHIPVVIDGGSWKPGFENVLPLADYVICSANFHPPHCQTESETIAYLQSLGIPHLAITHGENPIRYCDRDRLGTLSVPPIQPVDTLGAGDIFHGAFCYYIRHTHFVEALAQAARIAAKACQSFGTRRWMER
jgi:sugar/nucleoside kinase (ribokinase family)